MPPDDPGAPRSVRILIVTGDGVWAEVVKAALVSVFPQRTEIESIAPGEASAGAVAPGAWQVVVFDTEAGGPAPLESLRSLRRQTSGAAVLAVGGGGDLFFERQVLEAGAREYVLKCPLGADLLAGRILRTYEQGRTERDLRDTRARLRSLERHKDAVLRAVPAGLCTLRADWSVAWANDAMARLFRASGGEGRSFRELFASPQDFAEYTQAARTGLISGPEGVDRREVALGARDGASLWCEVSLVRLDPEMTGAGYLATVTDVTPRKRAEIQREALVRMAQRLAGPLAAEEIGRILAEECRTLFRYDSFWFDLYDSGENTLHPVRAEDTLAGDPAPTPMAPGQNPVRLCKAPLFASGTPTLLNRPNAEAGCRSAAIPVSWGAPERRSRSLMFAPVVWEGKVVAVLSVQSASEGFYGDGELQLLAAFADSCGAALERARTQEALRRSETLYRGIVEDQTDVIVRVAPDGAVLFANPAACSLLGHDAQTLAAAKFLDCLPPYERNRVRQHLESLKPDSPVNTIEHGLLAAGERQYRMIWTDRAVFDERGDLLFYQKAGRDVTQLRSAESALRRSDRRLELLVSQIPALLWTTDRALRFTSVLGLGPGARGGGHARDPEELIGLNLREVLRRADRDAPALAAHRAALEGQGQSYEMVWERRHYEVRVEPLRAADGAVVGTVGIALDVTERLESAAEQRRLQDELHAAEKLAAVGRVMASVGHCMKNMVTGLKGGVFLLDEALAAGPADSTVFSARDLLKRSTARISMLLLNMLDVSRERTPQFRETSILDLVEDVAAVLKVGAGGYASGSECSIDVQTQVDREASVFCVDPDRLYRALLNLGVNALDAMPEGGQLRIRARLAAGHELEQAQAFGPVLRLDVSDTGTGIPPEVLSRIYEPFFSTKPSRGTGLGLPATSQFVDEHGGRLLVQSQRGSGTTFTLLLPANEHRECEG